MIQYRLIKQMKTNLKTLVKNQNNRYIRYNIKPGIKYVFDSENEKDTVLIQNLMNEKYNFPYSEELEEELKQEQIEYEIIECPVCGGRSKKLQVYPIIVEEVECN